MKKFILLISMLFLLLTGANAQDTLFIYDSGALIMKRAVADIDSITFYRSEETTVMDIDGNVYPVVQIGAQTWLAENLRTSHYNDNTPIPLVTEATEWSSLTTGAYCWFDNDSAIHEIPYGKLYNWYAVNSEKLCPAGWHIPVESEWLELANYLGGNVVAGGKLKSTGTIEDGTGLWEAPNDATNETGFSGHPGGRRYGHGSFEQKGMTGYWWSPQQDTPGYAFFWTLRSVTSGGGLYGGNQSFNEGMSVRCIKD